MLIVKVGAMSMQTTAADVAPVGDSKASRAAAATSGKAAPQKRSNSAHSQQGMVCQAALFAMCWQMSDRSL